MGINNSLMVQPCDLYKYMHDNNVQSFKQGLKYMDVKGLNKLLLHTMNAERKHFFDLIIDKLETIATSDPSLYCNPELYEQCFEAANGSDSYFVLRLVKVNKNIIPAERRSLLDTAVYSGNEILAHQLLLHGADVNVRNARGTTALQEAIRCDNLELVCMLLCYGAYTNDLGNNLTPFEYAICCQSSEEIQRVLMDFETDFNSCSNDVSTLYHAIQYNSPVTLEIIKRGADVNFFYCEHNAISLAMYCGCDSEIFRILWELFDYEVWRSTYGKSVLLKFLEADIPAAAWTGYLHVLMEDEEKLKLDLEHHNNSYFFKSNPLVSGLYWRCLKAGIKNEVAESWVFHILSHGAYVFKIDLNVIYAELNAFTPFLELLLYMKLQTSFSFFSTFMYFKYTPVPDLEAFLADLEMERDVDKPQFELLNKLRQFYSFSSEYEKDILEKFRCYESEYGEKLEICATFPSLLELSRDAARKMICDEYQIKDSCKLYTIVRHLDLPKYVQDILFYDTIIYFSI